MRVSCRVFLALLPPLFLSWWLWDGRTVDPAYVVPPGADTVIDVPFPRIVDTWHFIDEAWFPAERMYERINGRATYYEQFSPEGLLAGTWERENEQWDLFAYRMREAVGAKAAYVGERPQNASGLDGITGYVTPGLVAVHAGQYYVLLSAREPDTEPTGAIALANTLATRLGSSSVSPPTPEGPRLPDKHQLSGTLELLMEDAFGYASLAQVQQASYALDGETTTWFVASGGTPTLRAYANEIRTIGLDHVFDGGDTAGGSMFDAWEMLGIINGVAWGIRDAPSREVLEAHWQALQREVGP